jgi:hypothetical protein
MWRQRAGSLKVPQDIRPMISPVHDRFMTDP